jgi:hypothetical protein
MRRSVPILFAATFLAIAAAFEPPEKLALKIAQTGSNVILNPGWTAPADGQYGLTLVGLLASQVRLNVSRTPLDGWLDSTKEIKP